jgi:nitric oxide reductase NorD protein
LATAHTAAAIDPEAGRGDLASSKPRLRHLLRALFDLAPELLPVTQGIATQRPFLSNLGIHLPEAGRALRGRQAQRWYDAATMHAGAHLRHSTHRFERGALKPIQVVLVGLLEDARVEGLAIAELPGLRRLWLPLHGVEPAHGDSFVVLMLRLARALLDPAHADPHPWVAKGRRLFGEASGNGQALALMTPAALRGIASLLGNDIGQMRLQFNARDHVVEPAYRDDNAHLWEPDEPVQAQAIERPGAGTPQGPPPAETAARERPADAAPLAVIQYPEWDRLVGDYRGAWCTVLEGRPAPGDPTRLAAALARHAALLRRLERVLRLGRGRERARLRGQLLGDELDLDAAVGSAIERRARRAPGPKVYQRTVRRERDVAALVLLDSSASTADPLPAAGDAGRPGASVLDLAREAALLSALTLARAGDHCAIHAFASNGRHAVHYQRPVDFGDAFDAGGLAALAGIGSGLSTRMGAALRHATALLAKQARRQRLLLFVTDGEPHDIDIYDRRYLVEDARRAVLEAARHGVTVFCVTLDPAADPYVRTIFGAGNYRVLDRIESLPQVLPALLLRLTLGPGGRA